MRRRGRWTSSSCPERLPRRWPRAVARRRTRQPRRRSSPTTSSTVPGQEPSAGCTGRSTAAPAGDIEHSIAVGGVVHSYLLAVPADSEPGRPAPLILMFHGFGSNSHEFAQLTEAWRRGVHTRGDVVVTPDGPNNTWNLDTARDPTPRSSTRIVASVSEKIAVHRHAPGVHGRVLAGRRVPSSACECGLVSIRYLSPNAPRRARRGDLRRRPSRARRAAPARCAGRRSAPSWASAASRRRT